MPSSNQRVGEYVLQDRIAAGTFGEVWRAHHHVWSDRLAAVKIPLDPAFVRRLQQEGLALHHLAHPNVVPAIAFDPFADPPYLVTEFVPGTSLRPLIVQRSLSIEQAM
jgi:serine/threonine protein kinase